MRTTSQFKRGLLTALLGFFACSEPTLAPPPAWVHADLAPSANPGAGTRMYWTDASAGEIARANLDGTGVGYLVTGSAEAQGIAHDMAFKAESPT